MRKLNTIILFMFLGFGAAHAQLDPLYNQYMFNQSMINPAYTGINDVFNATFISRAQWVGIEGTPITNSLNVSSSLMNNKIGAGLLLISDQYGINNNTEVQAMFAYRIETSKGNTLSFGLMAGNINYKYDFNKLNQELPDQALLNAQDNVSNTNFGMGIYYRAINYYLGISVPRILNLEVEDGNETSTRYRRHYYISGGYVFDQMENVKFKPSVLLKVVDGQPASFDLNAHFLLKEVLWIGATVRNFNAAGLNTQIELNDQFRFGYSFELPLNAVGDNAYGSHEVMLSMDLAIFDFHNDLRRYF